MAKKPAQRNPNGRPSNRKWEPTEADMAKVEKVGGLLTEVQLADMFGISERTLRRRFKDTPELEVAYRKGRATTIGGVAQNLVAKALKGNVVAMIFYLKTQAGWRETERVELEGTVRQEVHVAHWDLSKLSPKELKALLELSKKAEGEAGEIVIGENGRPE